MSVMAANLQDSQDTLVIGWRCSTCTLMNALTRSYCDACGTHQPQDAVLEDYFVSSHEYNVLRTEVEKDKKVEARKVSNYKKLMMLEKADIVLSIENFECSMCLSECPPSEGVVLRECLHSFCKACLASLIEFNSEPEVKCPYRDNDYGCSSLLRDREVKALVTPDVYNKHLAKCVALAERQMTNTFHCKTPNCENWCVIEDEVNEFHCTLCEHNNCLTCQAIHDNMNCKQYQDRLKEIAQTDEDARKTQQMLELMLERREAMKCPRCEVLLMKKSGCDWLSCTMCRTEICWVTRGPRWGPGGIGDNSGGCKCRVGGMRCHPQCGNCH